LTSKHLIVISCENHDYHGWQAMVATYSCMQHQRVVPMLVVHGAVEDGLHPMFAACKRAGALVLPSRNYAGTDPAWKARNCVASMRDAAAFAGQLGADHLVVMDPDLVWTSRVCWPSSLATDRATLDGIQSVEAEAICAKRGITLPDDPAVALGCRVPYVVPADLAEPIGAVWWDIMEDFLCVGWTWTDQMVAFSLALAELGLMPEIRRFAQTNHEHDAEPDAAMIHYAHETPCWDKGWFARSGEGEWPDLWNPPFLPLDTVQGRVCREIRRTRAFFDQLGAEQPQPVNGAQCA